MQRLVPPAHNYSESCISGDVTIEECVALGPGVVLQAAPGSRLIVRSGVCLGAGTILQADGGLLEIQADAVLGARVLLVGTGTVGTAACIGSESTLLMPNVEAKAQIAVGSLLGDLPVANFAGESNFGRIPAQSNGTNGSATETNGAGRNTTRGRIKTSTSSYYQSAKDLERDLWDEPTPPDEATTPEETLPRSLDPIGMQTEPIASSHGNGRSSGEPPPPDSITEAEVTETTETAEDVEAFVTVRREEVIFGRSYVQQLMSTLFPHKDREL